MTKKEQAFALFAEGKTASSPEVAALRLKGNVKYNYYAQWLREGGTPVPSSSPKGEAKRGGGVISELEMIVEPEEVREDAGVGDEGEAKEGKGDEKPGKGGDGKKLQRTMVAGQGLTFQITISTKTLQLYQIAASMDEGELTIGDFIDTCVEDFFRGRGFDLGLIKIGGKGKNG